MFRTISLFIKSTRFKTTIWYTLIFLILEIILGIVIYFYLQISMLKQLDHSLIRQCDLIFHFVNEKSVDIDHFIPDSIYSSPDELVYDLAFEAISQNPNNTFIQVMYKKKIIFQTENLKSLLVNLSADTNKEKFLKIFSDKNISSHEIRAAVLNKNDYQIISAFPVVLINDALTNLTDLYIIIAPIFLIIAATGGAIISVKALSRIDSIIEKTKYITTQNLDEKISGENISDEYGRLVKTMNEMIIRIKTSIDYMNQFSISAAHELKTPLTILRGETELALRSKGTSEDYRTVLQSNLDETLRLINIIDKLFFISKSDNSLVKINKERTELNEIVSHSIELMNYVALKKNIRLEFNYDEQLYAEVDAGLISLVLYNLIENAIKFSDNNDKIYIATSKNEEKKIFISVSNKGEYIPPELHKKIFERFFRIESSHNRNTGGAGLGLSLVKSIIELHGFEIKVESKQDGINTFTIII